MTRRRRRRPTARPGQPARLKRWPLLRMQLIGVLCLLMLAGLGIRAWALQIERTDYYRQAAERQHIASMEVPAPRGVILDAAGRELAVTADAASIWANPRKVEDVTATAERLAELTGLDVRALEEKLSCSRHFVWIRRHVKEELKRSIEDAEMAGVHITYEPRRYYPGKSLAGPILGFSNIDGKGIEGAELALDELLAGKKNKRAALRDAAGRLMLTADRGDGEAMPGATVTLTIDRNIQFIAERAVHKAALEHQAKAGSIVVLDVKTSEVLAMANWPTYDPNRPSGRSKVRNRSVTDAFEPGSVMKLITIAGALDQGAVQPTDTFDIEGGRIRIGRKVIRDSYRDDELDVGGVLKRSSNVGTIKIARALGKEGLHQTLQTFGFGARTGIELPGERGGLIHPTKRWGEIGLAAVSYGYMIMATPLQVAAAYASIGNGGMYNEPRIIKEVRTPAGEVLYARSLEPRRVIEAETAATLLPMLGSVFDKGRDGGTARSLDINGYRAGGKTGTSHKVDPATKTYSDELYISSFAGLAPIDDPRIAVFVLIDEPSGKEYYGAKVAGPAFVEVVEETLRYLGVPPTAPPRDDEDGQSAVQARPDAPPAPVAGEQPGGRDQEQEQDRASPSGDEQGESASPDDGTGMPDFRGLTVSAALKLAHRRGVAIVVEGSGRAVEQTPLPGFDSRGSECRVVFAPE